RIRRVVGEDALLLEHDGRGEGEEIVGTAHGCGFQLREAASQPIRPTRPTPSRYQSVRSAFCLSASPASRLRRMKAKSACILVTASGVEISTPSFRKVAVTTASATRLISSWSMDNVHAPLMRGVVGFCGLASGPAEGLDQQIDLVAANLGPARIGPIENQRAIFLLVGR